MKKTLEEEGGSVKVSKEKELLINMTMTAQDCKKKLWRTSGVFEQKKLSLKRRRRLNCHVSEQGGCRVKQACWTSVEHVRWCLWMV